MTCRAVLSIGANVGDALGALRGVARRAEADGMLRAASAVYATPPWGGVEQPDFLNAALLVEHPGTPFDLLTWCREREREAGRTREVRWGPRTLDVDIVVAWTGDEPVRLTDPELTLPHPRAAERAFVLVPWAELDPGASLEGVPLSRHLEVLGNDEVAAVRRRDAPLLEGVG